MSETWATGLNRPVKQGLPVYNTEGLPFPEAPPNPDLQEMVEDVVFDPKIHLALEAPKWIRPLKTDTGPDEYKFPIQQNDPNFPGLAFCAPFRLLSEEGVKVLRDLVFRNEKLAISVARQPKMVRGSGYRSKFLRDMAYDPTFLSFLSSIAGEQIHPENHPMNLPQINFGQIGKKRMVDKWHLDSVPYVVVLILSDLEGMIGGQLRVARMQDASYALELVRKGSLPESVCEDVQYPGIGHAIFMQGSRIAHCVTPVVKGREQRITSVLSFQNRNVFNDPQYIYRTFVDSKDPPNVLKTEHSRHIAWRIKGQMEYLIKNPQWQSKGNIVSILDNAADELLKAKRLIDGETLEQLPYKPGVEGEPNSKL